MHSDREYVSVGFENENDSLLKVAGGDRDKDCIEAWCKAISTEAKKSFPISDAMVESVMNDLWHTQVTVVMSIKPADREKYMDDMRDAVRVSLEKALAL